MKDNFKNDSDSSKNRKPVKRTKKQWAMFLCGITAIAVGVGILGYFGIRKVRRMLHLQKLLRENPSVSIPALGIRAPVLEGVEQEVLREAAGHFPDTGDFGSGNYCIAGHSSVLYQEFFNNLKHAEEGMEIDLYDAQQQCYPYYVADIMTVEPSETWILNDFSDTRITIVTCTDDGTQRIVVVGKPKDE